MREVEAAMKTAVANAWDEGYSFGRRVATGDFPPEWNPYR